MATIEAQTEKLHTDLVAKDMHLKSARQALKESELDLAKAKQELVETRKQLAEANNTVAVYRVDFPGLMANKARLEFMVRNTIKIEQVGHTFKAINFFGNTLGVHHTPYGAIDAAMDQSSARLKA